MSGRLFIHAPNVHQGGGRSQLLALLSGMPPDVDLRLSLDKRLTLPDNILKGVAIKRVTPSILGRIAAEKWLAKSLESTDLVLCFGNLPPLFKLRGLVVVFLQNRLLVDPVKLDGFSLKTRLRLVVERIWLSSRISNANEFIVQTPSMKNLLEQLTTEKIKVSILPFLDTSDGYNRGISSSSRPTEKNFDFLYVASGEPQKNHRQLIGAWCLLSEEGLFPTLKLTVDKVQFSELCIWIDRKSEKYQLNIENLGNVSHEQVMEHYQQATALIYPSTMESFGLPLLEARQAGLPVLASELDYVRDILDPDQAFDPESAKSIARAVKRFLEVDEPPLPLQDATGFIQHILDRWE